MTAGSYDHDVDQALDLVAESEGPDQWAGPVTVPEVIESGAVQRRSGHAMTEALGAAVREHERERIAQRVQAWLTAEGLGALLGEPLGADLLDVIRRG